MIGERYFVNPILLGAWGIIWLMLGVAIWSIARESAAARFELKEHMEGQATS
jgi:hypothetical protein